MAWSSLFGHNEQGRFSGGGQREDGPQEKGAECHEDSVAGVGLGQECPTGVEGHESCKGHSAGPMCPQDLVFDLGDSVRWEYMLMGTNKPFLVQREEEEEVMNDDDDMDNLVSSRSGWTPGKVPLKTYAVWGGSYSRPLGAEGLRLSSHSTGGNTEAQIRPGGISKGWRL